MQVPDSTPTFVSDDMLGVHLRVQEEVEKKKSSSEEMLHITNDMIISSCMQVNSPSCPSDFLESSHRDLYGCSSTWGGLLITKG